MKIRYLFLIIFILLCSIYTNVNASSINYNLRIDNSLQFYETITYNVDEKDVKKDGNYSFLTSIVNDPIYFDLNEEIKYDKNKKNITNGYLVTLKNDYSYLFLSKSRIINECFVNKKFDNTNNYISFVASDFYCSHRADNIKVSINTDLTVLSSNANSSENNTYIWDNITDNFTVNFRIKVPNIESEPMDDINNNENGNDASDVEDGDSQNKETEREKHHINKYVALGIVGLVLITGLGAVIVLKSRSNSLNKI